VNVIKVAINGYGRIGRNILRALYERNLQDKIKIVAINDLGSVETNAHLTIYDSTHGKFAGTVVANGDHMLVNGDKIAIFAERDPAKLPWKDLAIDIVFECTGLFTKRDKAALHLSAGANKVLISAPAGKDADATIVYGVNHLSLKPEHKIVSNGSCTTNCLAPLVWPLHQELGIQSGLMTTIHSYTNDQVLSDVYHTDLHRARSATQSMIPTSTGAAAAIGLVLPELNNKLDGFAMRVPTINVSVVDLTFIAGRSTSVEEVNAILTKASKHVELAKVVEINQQPLVSIDFNHNKSSSIYDLTQTKVIGNLVKVLAWYDNEWGFSNRMLDTAIAMVEATA
jgi:glyceraldehyde 3-phosphate dehydrogenase